MAVFSITAALLEGLKGYGDSCEASQGEGERTEGSPAAVAGGKELLREVGRGGAGGWGGGEGRGKIRKRA